MNFIETEEQTLLRQEVRAIAKPFGRDDLLAAVNDALRDAAAGSTGSFRKA